MNLTEIIAIIDKLKDESNSHLEQIDSAKTKLDSVREKLTTNKYMMNTLKEIISQESEEYKVVEFITTALLRKEFWSTQKFNEHNFRVIKSDAFEKLYIHPGSNKNYPLLIEWIECSNIALSAEIKKIESELLLLQPQQSELIEKLAVFNQRKNELTDKYVESVQAGVPDEIIDYSRDVLPPILNIEIDRLNSDIQNWKKQERGKIKTKIKDRVEDIYERSENNYNEKYPRRDFIKMIFPHIKHGLKNRDDKAKDWTAENLINMYY